jgi:hypothetical protein
MNSCSVVSVWYRLPGKVPVPWTLDIPSVADPHWWSGFIGDLDTDLGPDLDLDPGF